VTAGAWSLQRQVIVELAIVGALTALYLSVAPQRPAVVDLGLAALALIAIAVTAADTRRRVWGAPVPPLGRRHSTRMLIGTAAAAALFAGVGVARVWWTTNDWRAVAEELLRPTLLATFAVFVPWALLQQTLFQFYLLGRLRALLPGASALALAVTNGILFGAVHLPIWDVAIVTTAGGAVWSWCYLRDRRVLPIALSHAALGTTYFYWVRGRDLMLEWLAAS
jgi:membrane protease YdiL (CAAX protease family)